MRGILSRTLVASSAAVLVWSSSAYAQEQEEEPPLQEAPSPPAPPPAPPPGAQRWAPPPPAPMRTRIYVTPRPPREVITWEETTPNTGLISSGIFMFGASYGTSVLVAATSERQSDQALYVPLLGPWMDLANREPCPGLGCDINETGNRVLLVTSGLVQAAGAMQILGGFLFPQTRTFTRLAQLPGGVSITPSAGPRSVGITASGAF